MLHSCIATCIEQLDYIRSYRNCTQVATLLLHCLLMELSCSDVQDSATLVKSMYNPQFTLYTPPYCPSPHPLNATTIYMQLVNFSELENLFMTVLLKANCICANLACAKNIFLLSSHEMSIVQLCST